MRIEDLHPKTFIRKHLLSEEEEANLRRPLDDMTRDVRGIASDVDGSIRPRSRELPPPSPRRDTNSYDADAT